MKKGTPLLLAAALTFGAFSATAMADDIKKGQNAYLKMCKKCHGNGTKGAAMLSQDEWEEMFDDNGELIKEKHAGTKAQKFFNSNKFKKYSPYLKAFLYNYGNDSGNVPSC